MSLLLEPKLTNQQVSNATRNWALGQEAAKSETDLLRSVFVLRKGGDSF